MGVITLGLSQISVGNAANNGTMPDANNLSKIGKTYKDSCKMTQAASDVTEHYEEGKSAPEIRMKNKKPPVLTFSVLDPDVAFLASYVGGNNNNNTWGFDGSESISNRAVQVVPEQGLQIDIPNADIEAVINAQFSEKGIFLVDFTVTPLAVSGGKPIYAKPKT